jgi:hypothetical protein
MTEAEARKILNISSPEIKPEAVIEVFVFKINDKEIS